MVFSTDSDQSFVYLQCKSEKVHGLFGLGWKKQGHTVTGFKATGIFLTNYLKDKLDVECISIEYFGNTNVVKKGIKKFSNLSLRLVP